MDKLELDVSKRETVGKKVRFLRRKGMVPANLYGHGVDSIALQVDAKTLKRMLARAGKTDLISLKIDNSKTPRKVLIREVQREPLANNNVLHVDFYQVKLTEKIKAEIPLLFRGEAPVLKNKNVALLRVVDSLHIEALPDHLPHRFEVDLSRLVTLDDAIHVKDIPLGEGITLLSDPEQLVVKASEARKEVIAEVVEAKEEVEGEEGEKPEEEAESADKEE